jgi:hypothetical protein
LGFKVFHHRAGPVEPFSKTGALKVLCPYRFPLRVFWESLLAIRNDDQMRHSLALDQQRSVNSSCSLGKCLFPMRFEWLHCQSPPLWLNIEPWGDHRTTRAVLRNTQRNNPATIPNRMCNVHNEVQKAYSCHKFRSALFIER